MDKVVRTTDSFIGFWELQALIILCASMAGCAADKYHTQPGIHRYEHCKEVSIDVKNKQITLICPLEEKK